MKNKSMDFVSLHQFYIHIINANFLPAKILQPLTAAPSGRTWEIMLNLCWISINVGATDLAPKDLATLVKVISTSSPDFTDLWKHSEPSVSIAKTGTFS